MNYHRQIKRISILSLIIVLLFTSGIFAEDNGIEAVPPVTENEESISEPPGSKAVTEPQEAVTEPQEAVTEHQEAVTEPQEVVTEPQEAATEHQEVVTEPQEAVAEPQNEFEIIAPRAITAAEIRKYSSYKGKNATRIPILTYHKIVSNKAKKTSKYKKDIWTVSQGNFNKQMKWLKKKHYRTISCDEFYLWYMGKIKLPKKSVLITFDDGNAEAIERALPVLKKYNMKGTAFIVGCTPHNGGSAVTISESRIRTIQRQYPKFEFQSHTYALHNKTAVKQDYATFMKDAAMQRSVYNFDYLAYPYGKKTTAMVKAYKDSGIRMAFSFGDYGFATRKQNSFCIKRLAVKGNTSFRQFKKWCR